MDDVYSTFVAKAPNRERRELIFRAFTLYVDLVWELLPGARLWVDGGFVTHKAEPPDDVDVVIVVNPATTPDPELHALLPLLSLLDVEFRQPLEGGSYPKIQPMGGLVDGFLALESDPAKLVLWDDWWGSMKGSDERKGYLEVTR